LTAYGIPIDGVVEGLPGAVETSTYPLLAGKERGTYPIKTGGLSGSGVTSPGSLLVGERGPVDRSAWQSRCLCI